MTQDPRALLAGVRLPRLSPDQPRPDHDLLARLEGLEDHDLTLTDASKAPCVRALLWYAAGNLAAAHAIAQALPGPDGAYLHGMVHRAEGDFDNARYWFSQAAAHPASAELYRHVVVNSPAMASRPLWDPVHLTDLVEEAGPTGLTPELETVLRIEFEGLFDYFTDTKAPVA